MASQQDVYTVIDNTDVIYYPPRAEMHPMQEYRRYRSEGDDPNDFQGINHAPHYGVSPMQNTQSRMPYAGQVSHPQELPMHPMYDYHGYIPQGNDPNNYQNRNSAPYDRVYPMPSNQTNMPPVITNQPHAYSGPIAPPGQWSLQTPVAAPTILPNTGIKPQTKPMIIFKRMISVVFMLVDIVMAWIQLSELDEAGGNVVISTKKGKYTCPKSQSAVTLYVFVLCLSTLYTIVQIINVIGETIYDVSVENEVTGKNEVAGKNEVNRENEVTRKKRGFRFVHGFNEVVLKLSLKDIPLALLKVIATCNSCVYTAPTKRWAKHVGSYLFAILSSCIRTVTCKQKVKPPACDCECCCCCCCCGKKCCPDEYGCMCFLCYFPICSKEFTACMPVLICKYLGCCQKRQKGCFNCEPDEEDPKFALKILEKLYNYQTILTIVNYVIMLFKWDLKFSFPCCE